MVTITIIATLMALTTTIMMEDITKEVITMATVSLEMDTNNMITGTIKVIVEVDIIKEEAMVAMVEAEEEEDTLKIGLGMIMLTKEGRIRTEEIKMEIIITIDSTTGIELR